MMLTAAFCCWIGLTAGSFIYEAFSRREWGKAVEKSWYQGLAIVFFGLTLYFTR